MIIIALFINIKKYKKPEGPKLDYITYVGNNSEFKIHISSDVRIHS